MDFNVETLFSFENTKGTNIVGRMSIPFIDGVAHKPNNIAILSGTLDTAFRMNDGEGSKSTRDAKEKIIADYCEERGMKAFVGKPFFINEGKSIGIVSLMSVLNGYHANRSGKLFLINNRLSKLKMGMLFQNLKSNKIVPSNYINLDGAIEEYEQYFKELEANYYRNKKTSSTDEIRSKNG